MTVQILIAGNDPEFRNQLRDMVTTNTDFEVLGTARDGQEAIHMAMQSKPQIALIEYDLPAISGPQTSEILSAIAPEIMTVLISKSNSQSRVDSALLSGARALITEKPEAEKLVELIAALAETTDRRQSSEFAEWKDPANYPKVVSITGSKGGVGKTTTAVNLAITLAQRLPDKVLLLDLYSQFGDVATMLNVDPKRTIMDLMPVCLDFDVQTIQNYITRHSSGLHVMVTTNEPIAWDAVSIPCLDNVLYLLKRTHRYIIVDVPPMLNETTMHTLSYSNTILLIANLFDLTTVSGTKKLLVALQNEHIPRGNTHVILNRVSKTNQLQANDISRVLDDRILTTIPNDSRMVTTVNQGIPDMIRGGGNSPYRDSMEELADKIMGINSVAPEQEKDSSRKSIFGMR